MPYLICKNCAWEVQVSEEDPDSTLSDGMEHLQSRHPGSNPAVHLAVVEDATSPSGQL